MKLQLIIVVLLALCAFNVALAEKATFLMPMNLVNKTGTGGISKQIIQGTPATLGQVPWQAGLFITKSTGTFMCGGSLIHPQWVVTAAHCTTGATSISVRLGTINYNTGAPTVASAGIYTHSTYDPNTLNDDIGLVKLASAVSVTGANVKTIALIGTTTAFSTLTVSGWGKTCDSCATSSTLNVAQVSAYDSTLCSQVYTASVITSNTVCTVGAPYQSPCNGDSGGPLYVSGTAPRLVGVVSFVHIGGCTICKPAGYVRVANYRNWLTNITGIAFP